MSKEELYPMRGQEFLVQGLVDLCDFVSQALNRPTYELTICEIGSYSGESTSIFASRFKHVLAIDPWMDDYDPDDAACHHLPFSEVEKVFDQRMSFYPNVTKLKATSDDAIAQIIGARFDIVYIDGLHTYEQVKIDIANYAPLTNFIVAGHDYNKTDWPGVYQAVNESFNQPIYTFKDTSWAKIL